MGRDSQQNVEASVEQIVWPSAGVCAPIKPVPWFKGIFQQLCVLSCRVLEEKIDITFMSVRWMCSWQPIVLA